MKITPKVFQEFLESVKINDVLLKGQQAVALIEPVSLRAEDVKLEAEFHYLWGRGENADAKDFVCYVGVRIQAKSKVSQEEAFTVGATFSLYYASNKELPSDEVLDEFAKHQAMVHGLPFLREHIVTTLARMGYPRLAIPMLLPGQKIVAQRLDSKLADKEAKAEKGAEAKK